MSCGGRLEILLPYQIPKTHLVTSLLPNTQALKQRVVCFSKLRPAPLHRCGSRWSDRGLVGFVPVQRLETWTAFDPGSSPRVERAEFFQTGPVFPAFFRRIFSMVSF